MKRNQKDWLLWVWVYWVTCLLRENDNKVLQDLGRMVLVYVGDDQIGEDNQTKKRENVEGMGRFLKRREITTVTVQYVSATEGWAIFQHIWVLLDILLTKKDEFSRLRYTRYPNGPFSDGLSQAVDKYRFLRCFSRIHDKKEFKPPSRPHWQTKRHINECLAVIVELMEACPPGERSDWWWEALAGIVLAMMEEIEREKDHGRNWFSHCLTGNMFYRSADRCSEKELMLRRLAMAALKQHFFPHCFHLPFLLLGQINPGVS